jgi:multidrug resistance protein, MATE family
MKKGILESYFNGIVSESKGESYTNILGYFFPEVVTALILHSAVYLIDASFIACLQSTSMFATFGVTKTFLHFITKFAEGLSIGASILCGQYNGAYEYKKVGYTVSETFWISIFLGFSISSFLFLGAYWIYYFYGVPKKMIELGIPFLRLRAVAIFFSFVYFSFLSFLRGIKNTRTPMNIFLFGIVVFTFFDYALIFGKFGFPEMGFQGSALASVIQYATMLITGFIVVFFNKNYRQYSISLVPKFNFSRISRIIVMSWPVVLDKSILALTYIWLGVMLAHMGKYVLASYTVISDMERFAFLPAVAFAQVITFLVSNDFGAKRYEDVKVNIKKSVFLSSIFVFLILLILSLFPSLFISVFDKKGSFTDFTAFVFPIVSILIFLDVLQIILSGALRGIGQVKLVMWTRFFVCFGIFFPASYFLSHLQIESDALKFILIYGTFYLCNGIMSAIYIRKFRSEKWKIIK